MFLTQDVLALSINIIGTLSDLIISVIAQLGYTGIFAGMTLESVGLPIPSEVIMPFGGYVAWEGGLTLIGVALAGTFGCLVGSLVAYYIGLWGGDPCSTATANTYSYARKSSIGHKYGSKSMGIALFLSAGCCR